MLRQGGLFAPEWVAFLTGIRTPHRFKLIWPVLESKYGDQLPAERQAATMMYHDVKSRGLRLAIHGPRLAFFEFLMLPSGYTVGQLEVPELVAHLPEALQPKLLGASECQANLNLKERPGHKIVHIKYFLMIE